MDGKSRLEMRLRTNECVRIVPDSGKRNGTDWNMDTPCAGDADSLMFSGMTLREMPDAIPRKEREVHREMVVEMEGKPLRHLI